MGTDAVRLSKRLSWLLRHGAGEAGPMDEAGWSEVEDVVAIVGKTSAQRDLAVRNNDKGRLAVDGSRVTSGPGPLAGQRARGRGSPGSKLAAVHPSASLWRGTIVPAIEGIAKDGIRVPRGEVQAFWYRSGRWTALNDC